MAKSNENGYQLFILRHGQASTNKPCRDFERELTQKGESQAVQIGKWLTAHDLNPDFMITSPAKRALMTADIVSKTLNIEPQNSHIDSQIYEADLDDLLKVLARCSSKNHKILLVGHNPSLEYLIEFLLSERISSEQTIGYGIMPATLVHLEMNVDWTHLMQHCAQLISITHGKFLD